MRLCMARRSIWARAKHRVGLERPHFCTRFRAQSESWVAPAQQEDPFGARGENLGEAGEEGRNYALQLRLQQLLQSNSNGTTGQGKLMIFAGTNHENYLGCLNCAESASDSVSNEYGQNGSRYSQASIWNHYGEFGSPYQPYSACNPYSTDPPVIVDDSGTYYGRLTVNQFHPELGAGRQLIAWLRQAVCSQ